LNLTLLLHFALLLLLQQPVLMARQKPLLPRTLTLFDLLISSPTLQTGRSLNQLSERENNSPMLSSIPRPR